MGHKPRKVPTSTASVAAIDLKQRGGLIFDNADQGAIGFGHQPAASEAGPLSYGISATCYAYPGTTGLAYVDAARTGLAMRRHWSLSAAHFRAAALAELPRYLRKIQAIGAGRGGNSR